MWVITERDCTSFSPFLVYPTLPFHNDLLFSKACGRFLAGYCSKWRGPRCWSQWWEEHFPVALFKIHGRAALWYRHMPFWYFLIPLWVFGPVYHSLGNLSQRGCVCVPTCQLSNVLHRLIFSGVYISGAAMPTRVVEVSWGGNQRGREGHSWKRPYDTMSFFLTRKLRPRPQVNLLETTHALISSVNSSLSPCSQVKHCSQTGSCSSDFAMCSNCKRMNTIWTWH